MSTLSDLYGGIQRFLFPALEEEIGSLTEKEQDFVRVLTLAKVERFMEPYRWQGIGRCREERLALARSFMAKAVWNFSTTRALMDQVESSPILRRLCGGESRSDIPSEATFSRSFSEFAQGGLPARIHEAMVQEHMRPKLVGPISRDATAIEGRERAFRKEIAAPSEEKKRGRPRKDVPPRVVEPTRLSPPGARSLAENLADLPNRCDVCCKKNSQGYLESWVGFKLHLDCADGDIPVSAILTSAWVHDSQGAIPLAQMTQERVQNLYDLMDSAYDAAEIYAFLRQPGHVPLIDPNPRRGEKREMEPAARLPFKERSTAERANSNLKDNLGGRFVRVRGALKVMCHLMFGVMAWTAMPWFRLLS